VPDSNPQVAMATTCFQAVSSYRGRPCSSLIGRRASLASGRMTSVCKLRELESNQRPPGSEPGVTTNSNCPASFNVNDARAFAQVAPKLRGQESNLQSSA
jgi:hypothetical protein